MWDEVRQFTKGGERALVPSYSVPSYSVPCAARCGGGGGRGRGGEGSGFILLCSMCSKVWRM